MAATAQDPLVAILNAVTAIARAVDIYRRCLAATETSHLRPLTGVEDLQRSCVILRHQSSPQLEHIARSLRLAIEPLIDTFPRRLGAMTTIERMPTTESHMIDRQKYPSLHARDQSSDHGNDQSN